MNHFANRVGTWAKENKLSSALVVGLVLGVLFLTGTPIWWEPAKDAWRWAATPHGVPGWVLVVTATVVLVGYAKGLFDSGVGGGPCRSPLPNRPNRADRRKSIRLQRKLMACSGDARSTTARFTN